MRCGTLSAAPSAPMLSTTRSARQAVGVAGAGNSRSSRSAKKVLELALREALAHKEQRDRRRASDAGDPARRGPVRRSGSSPNTSTRAVASIDPGVTGSGGIAARASLAERQRRRDDDRPHQHRQPGVAQHRNQLRPAASARHRSRLRARPAVRPPSRPGTTASPAPATAVSTPAIASNATIQPAGALVAQPDRQGDLA